MPLEFESHRVRMIMVKGQPWWVASDVCRALQIQNTSQAIARLDEDEKGISRIYTPSGEQEMLVTNEPGLYSLIFTSTKPEAKRFKRWITHEVIPTIRRTGTYSIQPASRVAKVARRR